MANRTTSKRDEIMSSAINFVPTCGNCHKVIFGVVGMEYDDTIELYGDNSIQAVIRERTITPYCCPYCHTVFRSITGPMLDKICNGGEPYISYPQGYPME